MRAVADVFADTSYESPGGAKASAMLVPPGSPVGFPVQQAGYDWRTRFSTYDAFGNETLEIDGPGSGSDWTQLTFRTAAWQAYGREAWTWRTNTLRVFSTTDPGREFTNIYDPGNLGQLKKVTAALSGTATLTRSNPYGDTAPVPPTASSDSQVTLIQDIEYDNWGNRWRVVGPGGSCKDTAYDTDFAQFPVTVTQYLGPNCTDATSGLPALVTVMAYRTELQQPSSVTDTNGNVTVFSYDYMGRLAQVVEPDDFTGGTTRPTLVINHYDNQGSMQATDVTTALGPAGAGQPSTPAVHDQWTFTDGYGHSVLTLSSADTANGDAANWIASGLSDFDPVSQVRKAVHAPVWLPLSASVDLRGGISPTFVPSSPSATVTVDEFNRIVGRTALDGKAVAKYSYGANRVTVWGEADLLAGTTSSPTMLTFDSRNRIVQVFRTGNTPPPGAPTTTVGQAQIEQISYLSTGEVSSVIRTDGFSKTLRSRTYDSLGRLATNTEPNVGTWRYVYDDAGHLVGTSDARGCGENLFYDLAGRLTAEDYSPCAAGQAQYSAYNPGPGPLAAGIGAEAFYLYDQQSGDGPSSGTNLHGRLAEVYSRGAHTQLSYDQRGRPNGQAKQPALPSAYHDGLSADIWPANYATTWYQTQATYNQANQLLRQSTGATAPGLLDGTGDSAVKLAYSSRGLLRTASTGYAAAAGGVLRQNITYDAAGFLTAQQLGDVAGTLDRRWPDIREELSSRQVTRAAPSLWTCGTSSASAGCGAYSPVDPSSLEPTTQGILDAETFNYVAGQVVSITEQRDPKEWPAGAKPVNRRFVYDDFSRLVQANYKYLSIGRSTSPDTFKSPLDHEGTSDPLVVPYQTMSGGTALNRVAQQNFTYDGHGNMTSSADDSNVFLDRSIGTINNGGGLGPNQLNTAAFPDGSHQLAATYDQAGNLASINITCSAALEWSGQCNLQYYAYIWDEVGQLAEAKRWDLTPAFGKTWPPATSSTPTVDIQYAYDSGGQRVLRTVSDGTGPKEVNVEIFSTLRLDDTTVRTVSGGVFGNGYDYDHDETTEAVTLAAGGLVFGRLQYGALPSPSRAGNALHLFLEAGDHLGSTSIVIDAETSELVERTTYLPFGGVESDYRPSRWASFREKYKFTGKESDLAVGLTYFGARYLSPMLGRWISPDPLAIHALAGNMNPYAYLSGDPLNSVDAVGLCDELYSWCGGGDGGDSGGGWGGLGDWGRGWGELFGGGGGGHSGGSSAPAVSNSAGHSVFGSMTPDQALSLGMAEGFFPYGAVGGAVQMMLPVGASNKSALGMGLSIGGAIALVDAVAFQSGGVSALLAGISAAPLTGGASAVVGVAVAFGMSALAVSQAANGVAAIAEGVALMNSNSTGSGGGGGGGADGRFDGNKPTYHVNDAHVPGSGNFNPRKTPLPADAEAVFKNAVPDDPFFPRNWYGMNSEGTIYRFSGSNNGTAHFSGMEGEGDGIRNITDYALRRLGR